VNYDGDRARVCIRVKKWSLIALKNF